MARLVVSPLLLPPSLPRFFLPSLACSISIPHAISRSLINPALSIPHPHYGRLRTTALSSWSTKKHPDIFRLSKRPSYFRPTCSFLKSGWTSMVRMPRLVVRPLFLPSSHPCLFRPSLPSSIPIPHAIQHFLIDLPLFTPHLPYGRQCTTRLSSWSSILGTFVYLVTIYTSFAFSTRPVSFRSQTEILRCEWRVSSLVLSCSLPPCLASCFPAWLPPSRALTPSSDL